MGQKHIYFKSLSHGCFKTDASHCCHINPVQSLCLILLSKEESTNLISELEPRGGGGGASGMQGTAVSYPTFVKGNTRIDLMSHQWRVQVLFLRCNRGSSVWLPVAIENSKLLYKAS